MDQTSLVISCKAQHKRSSAFLDVHHALLTVFEQKPECLANGVFVIQIDKIIFSGPPLLLYRLFCAESDNF
jgi:hypothetical protein